MLHLRKGFLLFHFALGAVATPSPSHLLQPRDTILPNPESGYPEVVVDSVLESPYPKMTADLSFTYYMGDTTYGQGVQDSRKNQTCLSCQQIRCTLNLTGTDGYLTRTTWPDTAFPAGEFISCPNSCNYKYGVNFTNRGEGQGFDFFFLHTVDYGNGTTLRSANVWVPQIQDFKHYTQHGAPYLLLPNSTAGYTTYVLEDYTLDMFVTQRQAPPGWIGDKIRTKPSKEVDYGP